MTYIHGKLYMHMVMVGKYSWLVIPISQMIYYDCRGNYTITL